MGAAFCSSGAAAGWATMLLSIGQAEYQSGDPGSCLPAFRNLALQAANMERVIINLTLHPSAKPSFHPWNHNLHLMLCKSSSRQPPVLPIGSVTLCIVAESRSGLNMVF